MTVVERTHAELIADCHVEADVIYWRMGARYTRAPEKRKEARLEMPIADALQHRREALLFEEFSATWNRKGGALP